MMGVVDLCCIWDGCHRSDIVAKKLCGMHYQRQLLGIAKVTRFDPRPAVINGGYAMLPLGIGAKDGFAIIAVNFAWLDRHNWTSTKHGDYPRSTIDGVAVLLHSVICGEAPKGMAWDHINRDKHDNRRQNLRLVTFQQNAMNVGLSKNNTSGYKGVSYDRYTGRWSAKVKYNSENVWIGRFATSEEAAWMYDQYALELHGPEAWLNFDYVGTSEK